MDASAYKSLPMIRELFFSIEATIEIDTDT